MLKACEVNLMLQTRWWEVKKMRTGQSGIQLTELQMKRLMMREVRIDTIDWIQRLVCWVARLLSH